MSCLEHRPRSLSHCAALATVECCTRRSGERLQFLSSVMGGLIPWSEHEKSVATIAGFSVALVIIGLLFFKVVCRGRSNSHDTDSENTSVGRTLRGLEPSVVASFPIVIHRPAIEALTSSRKCAICLEEFQETEPLRVLPWCSHIFHVDCIDTWLRQNSTCPVCRMCLRESPNEAITQPSPALRFATPEVPSTRTSIDSGCQYANNSEYGTPAQNFGSRVVLNPRSVENTGRWRLKYWGRKESGESSGNPVAAADDSSLTININIDIGNNAVRSTI